MNNVKVSGRVVEEVSNDSMPMQGVMSNEIAGGDQISGKWINTRTGLVVYARQLIDGGDGGSVVTDKGIIPMSQFTEFVQMSDEDVGQAEAPVINIQNTNVSIEDKDLLNQILHPIEQHKPSLTEPFISEPVNVKQYQKTTQETSPNYTIIDKLFSKFAKLSITIDIDWGDFPKDKIETLIDIFDVPKSEIAEYIVTKFLNTDSLKEKIEESF